LALAASRSLSNVLIDMATDDLLVVYQDWVPCCGALGIMK
jgi:hypothetical protein